MTTRRWRAASVALHSSPRTSSSGGIAPMQQASVSQPSSYAARRPGARLAWIGQGFLVLLALAALSLIVPQPDPRPAALCPVHHQRAATGLCVRPHRVGLHDGVWHRQVDQLCPRRCVHVRRVYQLLRRDALPAPRVARRSLSQHGPGPGRRDRLVDGDAPLDGRVRRSCHYDRARGLQALA